VRRAAIAVAMLSTAALAVASPGRVVRVERGHGIHRTPRVCQLQGDGRGTCWGKAPEPGESASVIDQTRGVIATIRVSEVTPLQDTCGKTQRWDYTYTMDTGSMTQAPDWSYTFVVFDIEVTPGRSRVIADTSRVNLPQKRSGEQVWSVLDRDGDGTEDLVVTAYSCDKAGEMTINAPAAGYCIDYWDLDHGDWRKLRHDFVETCIS
jgi:hypothetical protein